MKTMIYVGSLASGPDRDSGWIKAFEALDWNVLAFSSDVAVQGPVLWRKASHRLQFGPAYKIMRRRLLDLCRERRPDWVHFRLPLAFGREDIEEIRAFGAVVTEYFNDDPFSPRKVPGLHMRFLSALTAYDGHFVYRKHNQEAFKAAGALIVEHCPPALDPTRYAGMIEQRRDDVFKAQATFIGHYEDDGRLAYLEALHTSGFKIMVHGSGWAHPIQSSHISQLGPAKPVFGSRYGELYANSLCGLCFFSKINRDTWTERPLEIIAVGGLLVCERTEEGMSYFKDGEEAFFFHPQRS